MNKNDVALKERRMTDTLFPLKDKGVLDDKSYKLLLRVGRQPGKMYGLYYPKQLRTRQNNK